MTEFDKSSVVLPLDYSEALWDHFERTGDAQQLTRAIDTLRATLTENAVATRDRGAARSNLGAALLRRAERFGADADLDEAIQELSAASTELEEDRRQFAVRVNLGAALVARCAARGDLDDLDRAIYTLRLALANDAEVSRRARSLALSNLGAALLRRAARMLTDQDVSEAIRVLRQAVALSKEESLARADALANLLRSDSTQFEPRR